MATLIANMQSAEYREGIQSKLSALKEDQEIAPILDEIEKGGPAAMMKCAGSVPLLCVANSAQLSLSCDRYWNDPAVLEKLSKAMGGTFGDAGAAAEASAPEAEAEPEEDPDVHSAASNGAFIAYWRCLSTYEQPSVGLQSAEIGPIVSLIA